jgi:high-affinity iron transporter
MQYVREQADKALNNGHAFGLAMLGFMVVYREGLETVLFYQALLFDAEATPVLFGFIVGLCLILAIAYLILRLSKRIPLKPLFTATTILLLVLAFSFTGSGIRELQEAGAVSVTLLPWFPENLLLMELFGLFPTLETILAQVIFTVLIALTFMMSRWQSQPKPQEVR